MKRFSMALKIICTFLMAVQLFLMASPTAMAQEDVPAVKIPEDICTLDLNPCGNSSICNCPDGYGYDANVGFCLIDDIDQATSRGFDDRSVKSSCSFQAQPLPTICTKDINPLGYPSSCACPGNSEYNELFGQCVLQLAE
ncbi:MAG: hypothetical protein QNJ46_03795 [Leptolyngbyaceae cyanobacterium MO_188.B28]|nr:hypothetical protein [Leptolyngbyaceae cyanobacterium MO_188.B28]